MSESSRSIGTPRLGITRPTMRDNVLLATVQPFSSLLNQALTQPPVVKGRAVPTAAPTLCAAPSPRYCQRPFAWHSQRYDMARAASATPCVASEAKRSRKSRFCTHEQSCASTRADDRQRPAAAAVVHDATSPSLRCPFKWQENNLRPTHPEPSWKV